ncbi:ATP-binding protein [Nocardia sp. NPDC050799]|uniref:ATP-binding protein n=1 Tax=Nocardia sp. NPDC050799 TaxID=3154842 RepID=UPI00340B590D
MYQLAQGGRYTAGHPADPEGKLYLHELIIRNNGPIEKLGLNFAFTESTGPIPHIFVGRNGTGKTNLLSLIGDALMEGANNAYQDVLRRTARGRDYFRVLGGKTITYGADGSYSIFRFEHKENEYFYHEATAEIDRELARSEVSETLLKGANWKEGEPSKRFRIATKEAREIYGSGVYALFPSSRSEDPFWLNKGSLVEESYEDRDRFSSNLDRPLFVEQGVESFTQWLLGVITESRLDVTNVDYVPDDKTRVTVEMDTSSYMATQDALISANRIIQIILDDPDAKFSWAGRRSSRKIAITSKGRIVAASLDSLSGGQATLLAIFGTILRYGDDARSMNGIVIIDELDAHMHIDLQMTALPKLIRFFPDIQFIVSSHSPLFALGMERHFSLGGVRIIEMPSGQTMHAEGYQEFEHALVALKETQAFANTVKAQVTASETPIILLAGQTDLPYFQAAARLLGYSHLVEFFTWIGHPDGGKGGKNTGDNSLTSALNFLEANPEITARTIIAIFDCDANKADKQIDNIHIIALPQLTEKRVTKGIENLLPNNVFTDEFYDDKPIDDGYGRPTTKPVLNKMRLCNHLCGSDAIAETFLDFRPILERIDSTIVSTNAIEQPVKDGTP